MFRTSGRKYYCEICKCQIPYERSAIQDHNNSTKHKRNKERDAAWQAKRQNRPPDQSQKFISKAQQYLAYEDEQKGWTQKTNKSRANFNPENQQEKEYNDLNQEIKNSQSIFDKAKIFNQQQYLKENANDQNLQGYQREYQNLVQQSEANQQFNQKDDKKNNPFKNIWKMQKDESGKFYFFNTLSKVKQYKKPVGLQLSAYEKIKWEQQEKQMKEEEEKREQGLLEEPQEQQQQQEVLYPVIGQWEEVPEDEGFFEKNELKNDQEFEQFEKEVFQQDLAQNVIDDIEQKYNDESDSSNEEHKFSSNRHKVEINFNQAQGKTKDGKDMIDAILEANTDGQLGSAEFIKTERLKYLAERDIDLCNVNQKPTFNKKNINLNEPQKKEKKEKKEERITLTFNKTQLQSNPFKKRVTNQKNIVKVFYQDDDEDDQ